MLLGALVDAGADRDAIASALGGLRVDEYALTFERVRRGGIAATWANVVVDQHTAASTDRCGRSAPCSTPPTCQMPCRTWPPIFAMLADAEGAVHGIDPADVELHEVGALDAIVDVVGVAAALHSLGIEQIVASPIAMGHGMVGAARRAAEPPPAVAGLLAQRQVPVIGVETSMELATPTGVAVLVALAQRFGALPAMIVEGVGYGAGGRSARPPERRQVLLGTATAPSRTPRPGRTAVQLEVNVDDVTGEVLALSRLSRRRRRPRRLGHTDRDEEGPPGAHHPRPSPTPPTSNGWPPSCSPRPAASVRHRRALAAASARRSSSTSTATRCVQARRRPSKPRTRRRGQRRRRWSIRCATSCGSRKPWPLAPT